jgi:hypothetical protein
MKKLLFVLVTLLLSLTINAQVSKIFESFESTTFPPAGWQRISVAGSVQWTRAVAPLTATFGGPTNVPKHGSAVAFINYDASGGNDWLISSKVNGIAPGDSLVFWLIKQFSDGPWIPDSLIIKVSTTDSLMGSFTNTPLRICIHCLPIGTSEIIWRRYTVPLSAFAGQNIFLAFQHTDVDGHGLILDSVTVFGDSLTAINPLSGTLPSKFELYQNYPNPFNPVTKIDFDIPKAGFTTLRVYDVTGAEIKTIAAEELSAGKYSMSFDASGLASGIYYYRLESNGLVKTMKMSLVK